MTERTRRIISDLNYVCDDMPIACLHHLRANFHRLIRGRFDDGAGGKCIFALLTENLPGDRRIDCRKSLTRFYGGDPEAPHYQPARALVRLWDGNDSDSIVLDRYGTGPRLTRRLLLAVLKRAIRRRTSSRCKSRNIPIPGSHSTQSAGYPASAPDAFSERGHRLCGFAVVERRASAC